MGNRPLDEPEGSRITRALDRRPLLYLGILVTFLFQIPLLYFWFYRAQAEFISYIREVGSWGILFTVFYKEFTWIIMIVTAHKNRLDLAFLWHLQAISCLFIYAHFLYNDSNVLAARPLLSVVLWYECWIQVCASAGVVLYYVVKHRVIPSFKTCRIDGKWCGWKRFLHILRHGE
jgi:hypothetical protein